MEDTIINILNQIVNITKFPKEEWLIRFVNQETFRFSFVRTGKWFSQIFPDSLYPYNEISTNQTIRNAIPKLFNEEYRKYIQYNINQIQKSINVRFSLPFIGMMWFGRFFSLPESVIRMIVEYALSQPHFAFSFANLDSIGRYHKPPFDWRAWKPNPFAKVVPGQKLGALSFEDFEKLRLKGQRFSFKNGFINNEHFRCKNY